MCRNTVYRLLANSHGDNKLWHSGGKLKDDTTSGGGLPQRIKPASLANEKLLVSSIIRELRDKLALDPSPAFERGVGLQTSTKKSVDFFFW
jgi:hypothetical protein